MAGDLASFLPRNFPKKFSLSLWGVVAAAEVAVVVSVGALRGAAEVRGSLVSVVGAVADVSVSLGGTVGATSLSFFS